VTFRELWIVSTHCGTCTCAGRNFVSVGELVYDSRNLERANVPSLSTFEFALPEVIRSLDRKGCFN